MADDFRTISPVDGSVVFERVFDDANTIERTLARAGEAFRSWQNVPLADRSALVRAFVELAVKDTDAVSYELTMQMGRPIRDGAGEAGGGRDQ